MQFLAYTKNCDNMKGKTIIQTFRKTSISSTCTFTLEVTNQCQVQLNTVNTSASADTGAVLRWGRGAQAPQMLARPPPKYFGSNSKNTHC